MKTFTLRTINKDGDYIEIGSYNCVEFALSAAAAKNLDNVIVSNTKTRDIVSFSNCRIVR